MAHHLHRRGFLQTSGTLGAGIVLTGLCGPQLAAAQQAGGAPNAEKLGWRLGIQTWTFRLFSLFDAIDMTASLGLKYIETYVGQTISKDHPTARFRADMPADMRGLVKKKLADSGLTLTSHYEVGPFREMFEFCKDMGVEMLISDPPEGAYGYTFDAVDKLCEEYGITLALTNHPKPAPYWSPETVLGVCSGRSKRIGASGDIGHWVHEGLNPTECVKKLEGRLVQFHFRDRSKHGLDGHDVPLGTGIADIKGILAELHRKRIKPLFMLEYEYCEENPLPDLAQSVRFFNEVAAELAANG
jgi:sugar phosphate isomerase/epimerase